MRINGYHRLADYREHQLVFLQDSVIPAKQSGVGAGAAQLRRAWPGSRLVGRWLELR
jgi:hypothetical protein